MKQVDMQEPQPEAGKGFRLLVGAPGRAHPLEGVSPLQAR